MDVVLPNGADTSTRSLNGNGSNGTLSHHKPPPPDGDLPAYTNGFHEPTLEELERELPVVHDGQVPLGELVSRLAQTIYAELTELAET